MPIYIPSNTDFDSVHRAVDGYNPYDFRALREFDRYLSLAGRGERAPLPIRQLVEDFNCFVRTGSWPPSIQLNLIEPALLAHPGALALALSIAILRPDWDSATAGTEYRCMRARLLAAWGAANHNAAQMRRKIVDEAVWFGAQQSPGWELASSIVYYDVFTACAVCEPFLEGPPLGAGLIPDLTRSWGMPFREELPGDAVIIESWLKLPHASLDMPARSFLLCVPGGSGCSIAPGFWEVLPGCKRNFLLRNGSALLLGPNTFSEPVPEGQDLMLRSLDGGEVRIQIAEFVAAGRGVTIKGPTLEIPKHEPWGKLEFQENSVLESWSCPCGAFSCDKRHRLSAWDPAAAPSNASLRTFLLTAVKGPGAAGAITLGAFAGGMYYALLCGGV